MESALAACDTVASRGQCPTGNSNTRSAPNHEGRGKRVWRDDCSEVISLAIQGGTPPYEIFWNNGDMGPVLSGVPPGNHFAFIIDALGCLLNQQFVLGNNDNVPPVIVAQSAVVPLNPVTGTVIMEPILETRDPTGLLSCTTRRATYVFRAEPNGEWLCVIDNSYGTDLLGAM